MAWKCNACEGWNKNDQPECYWCTTEKKEKASSVVAKLTIENKRLRQQVARLREDGHRLADLIIIGNNLCNRLRDLWTSERERRGALEKLLHEPEVRQHDDS